MRYIIELAYKGTNFHGWQRQPNAITVQETLETALTTILREQITLTGCGRTDTGVHAKKYFAHFDCETSLDEVMIVNKLNNMLGKDIVVCNISKTRKDFHARFDAKKRIYQYRIIRKKDPFKHEFSWYISYNLDIELMQTAADKLYYYSDFTSFSKLHTDVLTNDCRIYQVEFIEKDDELIFVISADRFLRNMVRAIVGTLVDVGRGKLSLEDFEIIIQSKDRGAAGQSAPAEALFLVDVIY
jgi:tRNA pseudouridine38-40 synthase